MRGAVLVLLAVTLAALMAPPAAAQDIWQEQLALGESWGENDPKMWGDTIYYADHRAGYPDVYAWDPVNGSRPIIQGPKHQYPEAVYEDKLVYSDYRTGTGELYLWDPVSGSHLISSHIGVDAHTSIYGNVVAWEDYRAGIDYPRVYMWDPVNGERRITTSEASQYRPRIWGNRIVWVQDDFGSSHVYMWTPEGGVTLLGNGDYAAIYQDKVVLWQNAWWEYPPGVPSELHPGFLKEWTPETGLRTILQHDKSAVGLEVWGDLVVYGGAWDPVHGFTQFATPGYGITLFSLYENKVAWQAAQDIYLSTMVPEPSSLATLIGALGVLGVMTSVRRKGERR